MASNPKIPLPRFLKNLTSNGVSVPKAMAVAGKIYKDYHTPSTLGQLTDIKLKVAGIDDKDERKLVLTALRKAGYVPGREVVVKSMDLQKTNGSKRKSDAQAGPLTLPMTAVDVATTPSKKRKSGSGVAKNEFLPDGPDQGAVYGSLEFNEILDEKILKSKSTIINRAPLMTAWATIVAEHMGFRREEALSIASVYTEMNAISKGVSLGIFEQGRKKEMEATRNSSQPYVDLMGRRVALYQTASMQWRALSNNEPVHPSTAFSYISRAFRQTTPHILGALRLLAASFTPQEISDKGWSLYADFRPAVEGWGKRGEVKCDVILALRKGGAQGESQGDVGAECDDEAGLAENVVRFENLDDPDQPEMVREQDELTHKKRGLSLEDYEAALDDDTTFNDIALTFEGDLEQR